MDDFLSDIESGEIQLHNSLQFELKSEYIPHPGLKCNEYTQEFYLFIPDSLKINNQTYSKEQFYRDQSNYIRYKTPIFSLSELIDLENHRSPIFRIFSLGNRLTEADAQMLAEDELKLLGNIVNSSLRRRTSFSIQLAKSQVRKQSTTSLKEEVKALLRDLQNFRDTFFRLRCFIQEYGEAEPLLKHLVYVEEFISNSVNYSLTEFLRFIRSQELSDQEEIDKEISTALLKEKQFRITMGLEPKESDRTPLEREFFFYRAGLLHKYVLDALHLEVNRSTPEPAIKNVVGCLAAGIAMLIYFVMFIWLGKVFIINSQPFIITTVVLYILKDRLKEGVKTVSYGIAFKWFSDYTTAIKSPDRKQSLGSLEETFSFVLPTQLPSEIVAIRNKEFHHVLEDFTRPESVIYYKKKMLMEGSSSVLQNRRHNLNIIFRFNIMHFLAKADYPYHTYWSFDDKTSKLHPFRLPKVYHVNIIMKNTIMNESDKVEVELKKFRLVIDKNGIKRIERVT